MGFVGERDYRQALLRDPMYHETVRDLEAGLELAKQFGKPPSPIPQPQQPTYSRRSNLAIIGKGVMATGATIAVGGLVGEIGTKFAFNEADKDAKRTHPAPTQDQLNFAQTQLIAATTGKTSDKIKEAARKGDPSPLNEVYEILDQHYRNDAEKERLYQERGIRERKSNMLMTILLGFITMVAGETTEFIDNNREEDSFSQLITTPEPA